MMIAVSASAAINVIANLMLVPRWGIMGAAVSTTIGYGSILRDVLGHGRGAGCRCRSAGSRSCARALAAAVMYVALSFILPNRRFVTVAVRAVVGLVIYGAIIAAIDSDGRSFLRSILAKVRARLTRK